jgi:hypothetical protein
MHGIKGLRYCRMMSGVYWLVNEDMEVNGIWMLMV